MVFTNTPNSYTLNANKIYITKPKFLAIFIHSKNQRTKDKNNYDDDKRSVILLSEM